MTIGEILKAKRKALLMTQEQVAEQIFVSQKSISNWETQKTYPDIDSLIRLAHLYQLSLDQILLEDSDIVKNIKKQSELKTMQKLAIPPMITNIGLTLLAATQHWWGPASIQALIIILISMFANFIPMFYFRIKVDELANQVDKKKLANWLLVLYIVAVIIIAVVILHFLPNLFKWVVILD